MLETAAGLPSAPRNRITAGGWRIVLLASLGGTLEFFDFVVFGIFARDIAEAIFPNTSPLVSLMASFAAFAVGYLARPIGGIVLSHYGDRHGRRRVFLWSVFVMSLATFGMGLVPTHAQWGAAASALMVTLRIVQGFCLGGELPGALTYVVETAPRIAPFVCGVVFACVTMGVAAATGVSLSLRTLLAPDLVPVLAWRLAFVLGGLGGVLSFVFAPIARGVAGICPHTQPGFPPAVPGAVADTRHTGPRRLRRARRDGLLQWSLFLTPAGASRGCAPVRPTSGACTRRPSASSLPRGRDSRRRLAR